MRLYTLQLTWMPISTLILNLLPLSQPFTPSLSARPWNPKSKSITKQKMNSNHDDDGLTTDNDTLQSTKSSKNIILIAYDGAVANTSTFRSNLAIQTAYSTWKDDPILSKYNLNNPSTDRTWVVNKLNALMQHLLTDQNGLTNCDAVLLTRLILEEQLLDNGRSVGKSGKYASKFHPTSTATSFSEEDVVDDSGDGDGYVGGSNQGSRPLTVGEIEVNWSKGACLRDTVRVKYNIDRKDPIPIITENICNILSTAAFTIADENDDDDNELTDNIHPKAMEVPNLHEEIINAFITQKENDCDVYIMVGHESHLPIAQRSLEQKSIPYRITHSSDDETMASKSSTDNEDNSVYLVAPGEGGRDHIGILQQMIMSSETESSIHFIHPIVEKLQQAKVLYGDNMPR